MCFTKAENEIIEKQGIANISTVSLKCVKDEIQI